MAKSQKQRKIDDLSRVQRRNLYRIKKDLFDKLMTITYIENKQKNPDKVKKKDLKKGGNANLGIEGIIGINTFETYKDRLNTFVTYCVRHHNLTSLAKIKPRMVTAFFEELLDKTQSKALSVKTLKNYLNGIRKLEEVGVANNIISLQNLVTDDINRAVAATNYSKEDYRRGADGGYSLEEAKIIEKKLAYLYGEEFRLMAWLLWEAAPRISELRRIKPTSFKEGGYTGYSVELFEENQCKNNRPRRIPISEEFYFAMMKFIKEMVSNGKLKVNQNIWGKYSEDQIRYRIEKSCKKRIIDPKTSKQIGRTIQYSGVHDFRKACVAYWDQQFVHKQEMFTQSFLAKAICWHVDFTYEDLNWMDTPKKMLSQRPLNPIVKKIDYRTKEVRTVVKNGKEKALYDYKYIEHELVEVDIRVLRNMLESQILGHNRTNVIGDSYRTWKNTNTDKLKKKKPPKKRKRKAD